MNGHHDDEPGGAYPGEDDGEAAVTVHIAPPPAGGRSFATTWWGRAWLRALEDTALDAGQLRRGRRYAREGAVGAMTVRPGRVTGVVRDPDGTSYRSDVLLQELDEAAWDRLLEVVADRAGHIAALLDRDMPAELAEDAAAAGVDLLPGIGDLEPECGCDAWDHCPHTAALCYQVARVLDQDPFLLLLIRGRDERTLLDELQARSAARTAGRAGDAVPDAAGASPERRPVPGVPVAEVFAAAGPAAPLPEPPPPVPAPGRPPALDGAGPAPGLDPAALEFLAADAAARAHLMLREALAPGHATAPVPPEPTRWQDAVRMIARADPDSPVTAAVAGRLTAGCGRGRTDLARAVRAWEHGGAVALTVLEEEWTPDAEALARARAGLAAAWREEERPPRLRATGNRWTAVGTDAQLRYGPDGRWWPYRKERGSWWPAGPADRDPAVALAALLTG
ncbi:SWIM zinc finger family protein [Streptomyces pactum]|uniref:SWIM zinc finger family protein n=1 Tax=Streptomyces pactum TaxID=68249 RepID=UPI001E34AE48|nr:SWF or SNF family helicase [Streptomyces pactum]